MQRMFTISDYRRLTGRARRAAAGGCPDAGRLLRELDAAAVLASDDPPADLVRLEAFVTYSSAGRPAERRALIFPEAGLWPEAELSVFTSLGVALIGRRAGEVVALASAAGEVAHVRIEEVGPDLRYGFVDMPGLACRPT